MDRKITLKTAKLIGLLLAGIFISSYAVADATVVPQESRIEANSPAKNTAELNPVDKTRDQSQPAAPAQATTDEQVSRTFPDLERALIIATIVNFLIIIFGLAMYLVKRRMQQFSPVALARANQNGN